MDEREVALGGTEWTLVELGGSELEQREDGTMPFLVLDSEESRVAGSTGCNRLAGTFAVDESELHFGPPMTTRMACAEDVMQRETDFLAALGRVTAYDLEGASLALLAGDEVVARLAASVPME